MNPRTRAADDAGRLASVSRRTRDGTGAENKQQARALGRNALPYCLPWRGELRGASFDKGP